MNKKIAKEIAKAIAIIEKANGIKIKGSFEIAETFKLPTVAQKSVKKESISKTTSTRKGIITIYSKQAQISKYLNREFFAKVCKNYGFNIKEYGKGIYFEGCYWHVIGINPRARLNPIVCADGNGMIIGLSVEKFRSL